MTLLAILFAVAYVILLLYYLTGWIKLKTFDIESKTPEQKFSIIIPARNEETNIQYLISDLFKQNYPNDLFEILIVDDHSEDYTAETVDKFLQQEEFSNLRLLQLRDQPSSGHGKKAAITYAVEKSINDWIICTDADCRLNSNWLSSLAAFIDEKDPVFVSAVVVFHEERTFFEKMQSLEFMSLIGIGAATISHGKPTMCNGANMAFRRDVFLEVNGYAGNEHIASGDDEFLMHKMAAKYPG
ncbi:MAG: glycosyltransferase, partial [Bacteroidetes bacterium]|nr:glycosyltransferase [Bacteroidota bacterium]